MKPASTEDKQALRMIGAHYGLNSAEWEALVRLQARADAAEAECERLRAAFEQAANLVETAREWGALEVRDDEIETMRTNRRELLGQ